MINSKIISVGSYLPKKVLTNYDLEKFVNTSNEWIISRTGIVKRHIVDNNQKTSDLATKALINALINANMKPYDLDALIIATTTPDQIFPSTAVKVQNNIDMHNGFAFDIQAVCSGFLYGLQLGDSLIKSTKANKVAVIGAETMSKILDWKDRSTCVLFGDGAGAVILGKTDPHEESKIIDIELFSDGKLHDILDVQEGIFLGNINKKLKMNGREVFRHAVVKMSNSIKSIIDKNNLSLKSLDWVLLHQANERITQSVLQKLDIRFDKAISTIKIHANTSAASIPLALENYISRGLVKSDQLIALSAVGGGLTWAAALIKL